MKKILAYLSLLNCLIIAEAASASESIAQAFAEAIAIQGGSEVVLVERLSEGELLKIANDGGFSLQDLESAFDGVSARLIFKVIDSVSGDNIGKHLIISQSFRTGMHLMPEVGNSVFIPDPGTRWVVVMKVERISNGNKEIEWMYKGEIVDARYGLLPSGVSRVIEGLNGLAFLKDLKAISFAVKMNDFDPELVNALSAPLSERVLVNVLKRGVGK